MLKFNLSLSENEIIQELKNIGKTWVTGSTIRDALLGKIPKNINLHTDITPNTVESLVMGRNFIVLPLQKEKEQGIIKVVDKNTGKLINIITLRQDTLCNGNDTKIEFTDNLLEDLQRRDFTINAMAASIDENGNCGEIIDPFNGILAIQEKFILFIGESPSKKIKEDYLRMIRACRFLALGEEWQISGPDRLIISDFAKKIALVKKEKIRDEILKALSYKKPSNFFKALDMCGLLGNIFPDLALGIGCAQNDFHSETVYQHLMRCVDASVELTDNVFLRLAAATHDIGKPHTKSTGKDNCIHFYKHEIEGASIVYKWMKKYKFTKKDITYVSKCVRFHQWRFSYNSKDKTIKKWLQAVGKDTWKDLITLRCADRKGNLTKANKPMVTKKMRELIEKAENIINSGVPVFREDLAITGEEIKKLGIPPGKIYQEIFSNLIGICVNDSTKNTKAWLSNYILRNYCKKKDI